jgi:hypothetical protein
MGYHSQFLSKLINGDKFLSLGEIANGSSQLAINTIEGAGLLLSGQKVYAQ